jgi:hypothetical protein
MGGSDFTMMQHYIVQALKLLGFNTPLPFVLVTYWFFRTLDKKASGEAKRRINKWLTSKDYEFAVLSSVILEAFDRVYSRPLLRPRAFFRSGGITIVVTVLAVFLFFPFAAAQNGIALSAQMLGKYIPATQVSEGLWAQLEWQIFIAFITNILGDYLGLFGVRFALVKGQRFPIWASLLGPIVGAVLIFVVLMVRDFMLSIFYFNIAHPLLSLQSFASFVRYDTFALSARMDWWTFFFGAMVVYIWLPLLALSLSIVKLLNNFRVAVTWTQWFIKRGKDHPFEAVGLVATPIVFVLLFVLVMIVRT